MMPVYGSTFRRRFLRAGWLLMCLCPLLVQAQTQTRNYIQTHTLQTPITGDSVNNLPAAASQRQVQYFDELGRSIQTVTVYGAPNAIDDVVQPMQYDTYGREVNTYLPYTTTGGGTYKDNPLGLPGAYNGSPQYNFYNNQNPLVPQSPTPFAVRAYEPNPAGKVIQQGAPGVEWQPNANPDDDHTVKTFYETNQPTDVRHFSYDELTGNVALSTTQPYYATRQLYITRTLDEQHAEQITYTDKAGRVILKKVQFDTGTNGTKLFAETYYIYDIMGNLVYVLPPEAVKRLTAPQN
jgi:hypothetical protein